MCRGRVRVQLKNSDSSFVNEKFQSSKVDTCHSRIYCVDYMYTHFKLIIAAPSLVRYQLLFAFFFSIQPDKTLSMCGHKSFCVAQLARVLIFRKSLIPIQSANQVVLKFSYFSKPINCKTPIFLCW